jgi:GAF domain-containing protein
MDDLELLDLFTQFASHPPSQEGGDPGTRIDRVLLDRARLEEIAALRLTEPDVPHILRDICREASAALGLPIGLVTIVLGEDQHVAAQHGLDRWLNATDGTSVEWDFCRHTVADKASFVVSDARTNARVQNSPLVINDGLRCYAGMPLITSRGHAVGSMCVAGVEAREFTTAELETLQRYATETTRRIETRRLPTH